MIYCPKCGTANRQGSKFCNECGSPLPATGLRCPTCGALNPVGNVYCDRCNTRLIPPGPSQPPEGEKPQRPAPIKGISLPSVPLEETARDRFSELQDFAAEAGGKGVAEEEIGPLELPSWLTGVEPASPGETIVPEEPSPLLEAPDWLQEVIGPVEPSVPGELTPAAEVPDWLRGLEAPAAPIAPEEAPPAAEMPDWLKELAGPTPPEGTPAGPPPFTFEEPSPPPVPSQEIAPPLPPGEISDWLRGLEPVPPEGPSERVPPVILDVSPRAAPVEQATVPPLVLEEEEEALPATGVELPDWLKVLEGEQPAAPPADFGGLVPAEIPEWLRAMQPREEVAVVEEPVESEGLLAGLRGLLPIGSGLDMPVTAKPVLPQGPSPATVARAELLQGLLSRPLVIPRAVPRETRRQSGWMVVRLLVGLALIAAIIAPMVVRLPFFGQPAAPGADMLFTMVGQLPPNTPVLVAWEYGPAEAEEMDRVAGPLIDHLLRQQARLVLVSTRMEGPASAEALLASRLADTQERLQRIANLGYVPGQAAGVREVIGSLDSRTEASTGLPAAQIEAMAGVRSVADVGMVVVLAAQPDDLRIWVEQVSTVAPGLPIVGALSARAELLGAPYISAGQIRGAISGLVGGAVYERQLDTGRGREYEYYLTSLGLAQWATAALAVLGALIFVFGGRKR